MEKNKICLSVKDYNNYYHLMFIAENICDCMIRKGSSNDNPVKCLDVKFTWILCDRNLDSNYATERMPTRQNVYLLFLGISGY